MATDNITHRVYISGRLKLLSPLMLGSGDNENTDMDVLRDWDGKPFIPGSSLAGVIRHHLEDFADADLVTKIFGRHGKHDDDSKQSLFYFYDCPIADSATISKRDGVHLDYTTKTVVQNSKDSKYDYEIVNSGDGISTRFKFEAIRRANSALTPDEFKQMLGSLIKCLKSSNIAVGAKTTRGFGKIQLCDEKALFLDFEKSKKDALSAWLNFDWQNFEATPDLDLEASSNLNEAAIPHPQKVDFTIPYSILIRDYSGNEHDADSAHLTHNKKPIIPGTSWNGALRHGAYNILAELGIAEIKRNEMIEDIFGSASDDENGHASYLTVNESIINGGQSLHYTRNKIDRFTGGVAESALFDEVPVYQGSVSLTFSLKSSGKSDTGNWKMGLILLVIKDMGNGIQPIGGDANIGRGILQLPENWKMQDEEKYLAALAAKIEEAKK